jgi:tRNA nucleotidyltransferase (CCA-adding enzyme)
LRPETVLRVLERCDALRRPERFELVLLACEADYRGRRGWEERNYSAAGVWRRALAAVRAVDAGAVASGAAAAADKSPDAIPQAIAEARIAALKTLAG